MWTLAEITGTDIKQKWFSSFEEAYKNIKHMKFTHIESENNGTTYVTKDKRIFVIEYWPEEMTVNIKAIERVKKDTLENLKLNTENKFDLSVHVKNKTLDS